MAKSKVYQVLAVNLLLSNGGEAANVSDLGHWIESVVALDRATLLRI